MPKDPHGLHEPSIPVAYARLLLDILAERGTLADRALHDARIRPDRLTRPDARLSAVEWTRLSLVAVALSEDEGLGLEYGLRQRPTAHGFLGYAAMASSTVREAVELLLRFSRMRLPMYGLRLFVEGAEAVLEARELYPIPVLRQYFYECLLVGVVVQVELIVQSAIRTEFTLCFDWPEPAHHARYRDRLPPVRFDSAANQLRMPLRLLDRPLPMADPIMRAQAMVQCERELASVRLEAEDVSARVRAELAVSGEGGYPNLAQIAKRTSMSGRTLKRKLQQQGTSFQKLLDEARSRDACALLEHSALDVGSIAEQLGYTATTNFTRAFRKWTGQSPTQYRELLWTKNRAVGETAVNVVDDDAAREDR